MSSIKFEDFLRLDLRVGTVLSARKVAGADKLYQLEVDIGHEKRALVAGVAKDYSESELVGRQIVVVANLEPRTIRGISSQGMLLAAEGENGTVSILLPDKKVPNGARVR
ncbi:MAG: methionine--tRNA ligase subunit beta [Candidatus Micrarchaeota archaeon]|nr:methionine--tRNA ligase subunit beta [Candidatus Micrarchaeota archaeon]